MRSRGFVAATALAILALFVARGAIASWDGCLECVVAQLRSKALPPKRSRVQRSLDHPMFARRDLIYGSEIGGWPMDNGRYDGYPAFHNPACQRLIRDAHISVIRWGMDSPFDYLGGGVTVEQFNNVIGGIHALGAIPFIKLPPITQSQCRGGSHEWSLEWLKAIVTQATDRVILYEFGNEPDYACGWTPEQYAEEWSWIVPSLKRQARSLGFEIYIGGPAWTGTRRSEWHQILTRMKAAYERTGDPDLVPSFISFHSYAANRTGDSEDELLAAIEQDGKFIDRLRDEIVNTWGFDIPIAVTEWNYTSDVRDGRDQDEHLMTEYTTRMLQMLRAHHVWLADQFTIDSDPPPVDSLDMISVDCSPKPQYRAFKAQRLVDRVVDSGTTDANR